MNNIVFFSNLELGNDERKINYYSKYIQHKLDIEKIANIVNSPRGTCEYLNESIRLLSYGQQKTLIEELRQSFIPSDKLKWIQDDQLACYYVWSSIKLVTPEDSDQTKLIEAVDHQERFNSIVDYLDSFSCIGKEKLEMLDQWKSKWSKLSKESVPFQNILEEENEKILVNIWKLLDSLCPSITSNNTEFFCYRNMQSKFLAMSMVYCTWAIDASIEQKELFTIKFKRMMNSFVYRKKQKEKNRIAFQCYISKEIRDKLTTIAKFEHQDANDVIRELIYNKYEQIKPMLKKM